MRTSNRSSTELVLFLILAPLGLAGAAPEETISLHDLRDKIRGGWAGQMIGVSYGFPTEFEYRDRIIPEDELPQWQPGMISEALNQDDLYVDITLASVLDRHGLDASTADFGALFRDSEYPLWHANLAARRALRRGVPAELSGTPKYNIHANDIDFQIESDFIGLMSPGLPRETNAFSYTAGRVMNHGDGIYGGMFVSAMYAHAFFENNTDEIVKAGLAVLPPGSPYAAIINDVRSWSRQHPDDWQQVWQLITEKWSRGEACPAGALQPFNIDAKINGAFVALALIHGNGDFEQTMIIATRAGQDSDCNPSSALGILGVVLGYDGIPTRFTDGIDAIANEHFQYTSYSFNDIVASTLARAIELIKRSGGRIDGRALIVKRQEPEPAVLEAWSDHGSAKEQVFFEDSRWTWSDGWRREDVRIWRYDRTSNVSNEPDADAKISFNGTGAAITGLLLPDGGTADVYLDGTLSRTIDAYSDEPDAKIDEAIWHEFGLEDRQHELRIVVRGESISDSGGTKISIASLIVYQQ